ncbi:hypothetical protein [Actinopolymorpha cephalotaxi]|nr:hypothetical protein [Actinopolymorpha cephalotaxi]
MVEFTDDALSTGQAALVTFLSEKGIRGREALSRSPLRLRDEV